MGAFVLSAFPNAPRATSIVELAGVIDTVSDSSIQRQIDVTRYPVSTGSTVSDHTFRSPIRVTLRGTISDVFTADGEIATAERMAIAHQRLVETWSSRRLVTLTTQYSTIPSMIISTLEFPNTSGQHAIRFSMTLVEVIYPDPADISLSTTQRGRITPIPYEGAVPDNPIYG